MSLAYDVTTGSGPLARVGDELGAVASGVAVGQHRVGRGEDLRGRAEVVGQRDDFGAGEVLGEVGQQRRVGAVPAVDRLVRVADDAQVDAVAQPALQQAVLHRVDVLELVDEQVAEAPARRGGELRVVVQRCAGHPQQVVEVDEAAALLLVLVALEQRGERVGGDRRLAPGARRLVFVAGRASRRAPSPTRSRSAMSMACTAGPRRRPPISGAMIRTLRSRICGLGLAVARTTSGGAGSSASEWNVPAATPSRRPSGAEAVAQFTGGLAGEGDGDHVLGLGACRSCTRWAIRRVSTRVLPEPAPARMHSGAAVEVTAAAWGAVRPSSKCSTPTPRNVPRGCYDPRGWSDPGDFALLHAANRRSGDGQEPGREAAEVGEGRQRPVRDVEGGALGEGLVEPRHRRRGSRGRTPRSPVDRQSSPMHLKSSAGSPPPDDSKSSSAVSRPDGVDEHVAWLDVAMRQNRLSRRAVDHVDPREQEVAHRVELGPFHDLVVDAQSVQRGDAYLVLVANE